ncbi:large conductance mechanosensitive channel protein MscL [Sporosarcina sp. GW1-11]|uniref:large conductance mechanosensitive channel protein MscL n=1 Tax=Sporosarcina sp. GW1-11 TaxID=2899126 RepID=UPI00294CB24B|nr:large conductance mechanosensitive channel protein MscL [Sporosarcina sp. GW1-11]MDV6377298.1 large conductance mechanosensitive channel protein MscL [Sporosarcina sp. GW1-11]
MWKDFKEFAFKGNIFDLAIGVVIGAAFGTIVSSLVENIMTPIFGILLGGLDFSQLSYTVDDAEIKYGLFIQSIIDFLIVAGSIFVFLRVLMKFKMQEPEPVEEEEAKPLDMKEELLTDIRDLLKKQQ